MQQNLSDNKANKHLYTVRLQRQRKQHTVTRAPPARRMRHCFLGFHLGRPEIGRVRQNLAKAARGCIEYAPAKSWAKSHAEAILDATGRHSACSGLLCGDIWTAILRKQAFYYCPWSEASQELLLILEEEGWRSYTTYGSRISRAHVPVRRDPQDCGRCATLAPDRPVEPALQGLRGCAVWPPTYLVVNPVILIQQLIST